MAKPRIAVQMIIFSEEVARRGYEPVLEYIRGLGVREVELSKVPVSNAILPSLSQALSDSGLHACAMNVAYGPATDALSLATDMDEIAACAQALDCGYVRVGSLPYWVYGKADMFRLYARQMNDYGKRLAREGIRLYHHHHEFEFQRFGDRYGLDIILEQADPAYVGIELDTHWLQYGGQNPLKWIERLAGRAELVHLKDYRIVVPYEGLTGEERSPKVLRRKDVQFAEIGTGTLDIPAILRACEQAGVKYIPIEQDTSYDISPYESMAISVNNIKSMGFSDFF